MEIQMALFSKTSLVYSSTLLAVLGTLALAPLNISAMEREDGERARPMSPFAYNAWTQRKATPEEQINDLIDLEKAAQHPACDADRCIDAATPFMMFHSKECSAQACAVFLSLLKNPAISATDHTRALKQIVIFGTDEQRAQALPCFITMTQDPPFSKRECLELGEMFFKVAQGEQMQALCSIILSLLPSPEIPAQVRLRASLRIIRHGTETQKGQGFAFLLSMMGDETVALKQRNEFGQAVLSFGTEAEKAEVVSFLMRVAEDSSAPSDLRSSAANSIFDHGTSECKMRILLLQASDPSFSACPDFSLPRYRHSIAIPPELRAFLLRNAARLYAGEFIPPQARQALIFILAAQPQDLWEAITAQVIAQYHRDQQFVGTGMAHEVHNYASAIESPVLKAVDKRLQGVPRVSYMEARGAVDAWIRKNKGDQAEAANQTVNQGLTTAEDRDLLALVYTFVLHQHPDQMDVFLQGFVTESMTAYQGSGIPTSCPKGITERLFTGLRGMDAPLDALFQAPETLLTAKTFIAQCNFGKSDENLQWMVKKLQALNVTDQTSAEDAVEIFKAYAVGHLKSLSLTPKDQKEFLAQLEAMADVLEEFYEDKIKPHMTPAQAAVDPKEQMRAARLKRFGKE